MPKRFDLERQNLVLTCREELVFWGSATLPVLRGASSVPQIFWDLHACTQYMRTNNQILHGDQARFEESLYTVDHKR